jgi:hypothetical protein
MILYFVAGGFSGTDFADSFYRLSAVIGLAFVFNILLALFVRKGPSK